MKEIIFRDFPIEAITIRQIKRGGFIPQNSSTFFKKKFDLRRKVLNMNRDVLMQPLFLATCLNPYDIHADRTVVQFFPIGNHSCMSVAIHAKGVKYKYCLIPLIRGEATAAILPKTNVAYRVACAA